MTALEFGPAVIAVLVFVFGAAADVVVVVVIAAEMLAGAEACRMAHD